MVVAPFLASDIVWGDVYCYRSSVCQSNLLQTSISLKSWTVLWTNTHLAFLTDYLSYLLRSPIWKAKGIALFLHQSSWAVQSKSFQREITSKQPERIRSVSYALPIFVSFRFTFSTCWTWVVTPTKPSSSLVCFLFLKTFQFLLDFWTWKEKRAKTWMCFLTLIPTAFLLRCTVHLLRQATICASCKVNILY